MTRGVGSCVGNPNKHAAWPLDMEVRGSVGAAYASPSLFFGHEGVGEGEQPGSIFLCARRGSSSTDFSRSSLAVDVRRHHPP